MTKSLKFSLLSLVLCLSSYASHAQQALNQTDLLKAFGWNFDTTEITTQKIDENLYVLFGVGGNLAVLKGDQGVLMVDDQFPEMLPKIEAAIKQLGGNGVDFVINTHWHFDHAEGNLALGPKGVWLVSQANSRSMMLNQHDVNLVSVVYDQPAYPQAALPVITFDDHMQFHFNEQKIDLLHFGPAHTTGDTAVVFRGSNAVHLGDVFNNAGYPFIDADNGGDVDGLIKFCQSVLDSIDKNTVVIPGHGPVSDYQGLKDYISVISQARDNIAMLVKKGASLEDVIAAKPTKKWDEKRGNPLMFIDRAYASLLKKQSQPK